MRELLQFVKDMVLEVEKCTAEHLIKLTKRQGSTMTAFNALSAAAAVNSHVDRLEDGTLLCYALMEMDGEMCEHSKILIQKMCDRREEFLKLLEELRATGLVARLQEFGLLAYTID